MNGPDQGDKAFPIDRVRARPDDPGRRPARRRHLPSLGSFATFEVAAKHLSFTLAASELNVTQAAISQHIRGLEKALGCKLFLRKHNAIELTSEGETLLEAVTSGLDRLSDAIGQLGRGDENATVTIAGTYAGASHYLKPMADAYRALHPEARFTLLASDENDRLQNFEEVDIAVICGNERSEIGHNIVPLFSEIVDPVCSPGYLARSGPFETPEDLLRAEFMELHRLHWTSDAINWYPLRWSDWFRHHADHLDPPAPGFVTNSYGLLVEAAVAGQGVILGWRHLVQQQVAEGRLVRIFDRPLDSGRTYYLKLKPSAHRKAHAQGFVAFLKEKSRGIPLNG